MIHLVDFLSEAEVLAPSPAHVELQLMEVGGDQRQAIFQHPDSTVRFALPPGPCRLYFACGIKTVVWDRIAAAVRFRVGVERDGATEWLYELTLDPRSDRSHRQWVDASVALPAGRTLVLETSAERGNHAWAGWADPRIEAAGVPSRSKLVALPHVVVVTADALRADFVNGPVVHTPHVDALAADGVRFTHARSASTTTPGSYASLFTGLSPMQHGVLGEWGTFPAHLPNLATELARHGHRSVFAPSERDLALPGHGFARVFAEVLPCLGNPSQEGAVTTRKLLRRLDRADTPLFVWAHYFDTHPPRPMPASLVAAYYDGDPRDPARAFRPELVRAIRGAESVLHIEEALPGLPDGRVDARLLARLRDTARALAGEVESWPDLAEHVAALGAAARRGSDQAAFAAWLSGRVDALEHGRVEADLVKWLVDVVPRLRTIEREVVAWLDGVVDYRWALAQPQAAATYVDAQVGALVAYLHEAGLYDDTTIVFTAPHGELYGEGGHHFHHHAPLEAVLRIPLVVKPAVSAGIAPGVVDGVFDAVDLVPTLLELVGYDPPLVAGHSRVDQMRSGMPIAPHDSYAVSVDGVQACLSCESGKLVLTRGWLPLPDGSWLAPGTRTWLDRSDAKCTPPADVDAVEARLLAWLREGDR